MISHCPGQDPRNLKPETIVCACGYTVEIFSDEIKAKCPQCRKVVVRERMPTCIAWCKSAKECVGTQVYEDYLAQKEITLKDKLFKELKEYFGSDKKRIAHALQVTMYAEELLKQEGGDWEVVIPASILHDVGIKAAEAKYGSAAGGYQEQEGPAIAEGILLKLGFMKNRINEICAIIGHHHSPGALATKNFALVCDADWLVNMRDEVDVQDKKRVAGLIARVFVTQSAQQIAKEKYL